MMQGIKQNSLFLNKNNSSKTSHIFLEARNLVKKFPGVVALDNVSFTLRKGEILALLGENGAGKSTLVKILYGIYIPDRGHILINGKKVIIASPIEAIKQGISLVSQVPQIIDSLTVSENIILGLRKYRLVSKVKNVNRYIEKESKLIGIEVDPNIEVWKLSYTQKQLVELLRSVILGAKVIILDEAITFLPLEEKRKFYEFMRKFVRNGGSVILITHKIPEALEAADRITVLRRGRVVGTVESNNANLTQVRKMMFGERSSEITYERLPSAKPSNKIAIKAKDLWVLGDYGEYAVKGISLSVHYGEVLGIAGIAGNGQLELIESVIGLRKPTKGNIFMVFDRETINVGKEGIQKVRGKGVGFIPDQPLRFGVAMDNNIEENIGVLPFVTKNFIKWSRLRSISERLIKDFDIKATSTKEKVKLLSGGNLMKVLVSRELYLSNNILVAYNPTRALDEVTAIMVRKKMKERVISGGFSILMASEDLDEILQVSDRIAVMSSGKIVGLFEANKVSREEIERLMVI